MDGRNPWWRLLRTSSLIGAACLAGCGKISFDLANKITPTTRRVVFAGHLPNAGTDELVSTQLDGTNPRPLSSSLNAVQAFAIAPNGQQVAFVANTATRTGLFTVPVDGGVPTDISASLVFGNVTAFQWAPDSSRLAFRAATANGFALFTVRPDGRDGAPAGDPGIVKVSQGLAWAPDSQRLAFLFEQSFSSTPELYTVAPDGSGLSLLSPVPALNLSARISDFAWAPNSSRLAFLWDPKLAGHAELFTAPAEGTGANPLIQISSVGVPQASVDQFAWSPGSDRLAYRISGGFSDSLQTTLPTELASTQLTGEGPVAFQWSPNGNRLAYSLSTAGSGPFRLESVTPDGGGLAQLTDRLIPETPANPDLRPSFAWAPAGDHIAFIADAAAAGIFELFASAPDGNDQRRLSALDLGDRSIRRYAWSPNGSRLAYIADQRQAEQFELYVVEADGSGNRRVSWEPMAGNVQDFRWASNTLLVYRADQDVAGRPELYVVEQDGTGLLKLSAGRVVTQENYAVTP